MGAITPPLGASASDGDSHDIGEHGRGRVPDQEPGGAQASVGSTLARPQEPGHLDAWWSETYGLHRHRWLHEPAENFVEAALRVTIPKHVDCRRLVFADA